MKALPKLQEEASDEELASGFEEHLEETRQHVKNIEQAFDALGEPAKAEKCPGIEGIKKEHDDFVSNESPSPEVLDSFLTGAGARTEHYEIAAYEGLVTMATAMGENDVAEPAHQEPRAGEGGASKDAGNRHAARQERSQDTGITADPGGPRPSCLGPPDTA